MYNTNMSFQRCFLSAGIIAVTATKGFFSSMNQDMTRNHGFGFHDFGTQRTFDFEWSKNNWLNNLQHFKKFQNIFVLLCLI